MIHPKDLFADKQDGVCVEVGASYGGPGNPSYEYVRRGWRSVWIEDDEKKFEELVAGYPETEYPNLALVRARVTPDNVCGILESAAVPTHIDYLVLDIDGYDYDVLDAILARHTVSIVEAEINEKIPPSVLFRVPYSEGHTWKIGPFFGMSFAALARLASLRGYVIVGAKNNNVYLSPRETPHKRYAASEIYEAVTEPYMRSMPYNADADDWADLKPEDAVAVIAKYYADLGISPDRYELGVAA